MTPNGNLELCYDERGHMYKVPVWCLVNPIEITGPVSTAVSGNGNGNGAANGGINGADKK